MTTLIYGTPHFVSVKAAHRYYERQGFDRLTVNDKLVNGEIFTFPPPVKTGEKLIVVDDGTRYAIEARQ